MKTMLKTNMIRTKKKVRYKSVDFISNLMFIVYILLKMFSFPILLSMDFYQYITNYKERDRNIVVMLIYYIVICFIYCIYKCVIRGTYHKGVTNTVMLLVAILADRIKSYGTSYLNYGIFNILVQLSSLIMYLYANVFCVSSIYVKYKYKEKVKLFDIFNILMLMIGMYSIYRIIFLRILRNFNVLEVVGYIILLSVLLSICFKDKVFYFLNKIKFDKNDIFSVFVFSTFIFSTYRIFILIFSKDFHIQPILSYLIFIVFFCVFNFKCNNLFENSKIKKMSEVLYIYMFLSVFSYDLSHVYFYIHTFYFLLLLGVPATLLLIVKEKSEYNRKNMVIKLSYYFLSLSNGFLLICIL